jgi:hypothetical protein
VDLQERTNCPKKSLMPQEGSRHLTLGQHDEAANQAAASKNEEQRWHELQHMRGITSELTKMQG